MKHHLANARSTVGAATTAQLVWILAPRLPEPDDMAQAGDQELRDRARGLDGIIQDRREWPASAMTAAGRLQR